MSTQKNFCLTVDARASQHYNERLPALHVAQLGPRSSPAYTSRFNVDGWAGGVIIKNVPTKTKLRTDARPSTVLPAYTSRSSVDGWVGGVIIKK